MKNRAALTEALALLGKEMADLEDANMKLQRVIDNEQEIKTAFAVVLWGQYRIKNALQLVDAAIRVATDLPVEEPEKRPTLRIVKE